MREVDDVGGAEIHLEAIDLVRQLLGAVVAAIRARRRGEGHKAGDGGGDQDRAADVQFENHDEKPLRTRIQASAAVKRKGGNEPFHVRRGCSLGLRYAMLRRMTKLLDEAIRQVVQLPEGEQDAAAGALLDYVKHMREIQ